VRDVDWFGVGGQRCGAERGEKQRGKGRYDCLAKFLQSSLLKNVNKYKLKAIQ
jgi:hypothetical protein